MGYLFSNCRNPMDKEQASEAGEGIVVKRTRPDFASDKKRAVALELFKHGVGYTVVAKALDLPANTTKDWFRAYKAGKFEASISGNQFRYSEETKQKILELRRSGASWREITDATGVSPSTVRRWLASR